MALFKRTKKNSDTEKAKAPGDVSVVTKAVSNESIHTAVFFDTPTLQRPHITEKAARLNTLNQYVFRVYPHANKNLVKKAVENTFKVSVTKVNIVNIPGKRRRIGRIEGRKPGYKKAIVTLKEGQSLDMGANAK